MPAIDKRISMLVGLLDEVGHWGLSPTYKMIADRFWWPGMRKKISDYVKSCDACQKSKPNTSYQSGVRMPVSGLFHTG